MMQRDMQVNCPLVNPLYPARWMAETQFRSVEHFFTSTSDAAKIGQAE